MGGGATPEANTAVIYKGRSWADAAQSKPPIQPFHLAMKAAVAVFSSFKPTSLTSIYQVHFILLSITKHLHDDDYIWTSFHINNQAIHSHLVKGCVF